MRLSDVVGNAGLSAYAVVALVLFAVVFAAIVIRTWWPSRRDEQERMGRLPLDDEPRDAAHDGDSA